MYSGGMEKPCLHCSNLFFIKPSQSNRKFCSVLCTQSHRFKRTCEVCQIEFEVKPINYNKKYCSVSCRKTSDKRICQNCNKEYGIRVGRKGDSKFCTFECSMESKRKTIVCPTCLNNFEVISSSKAIFCSVKCNTEHLKDQIKLICKNCLNKFSVKKSHENRASYCSNFCKFSGQSLERNFPEPPQIDGSSWVQLGKEKFALVDKEDFETVSKFKWSLYKGYAYSQYKDDLGLLHKIQMHRIIMNVTDQKIEIDHINGDTLNNKKSNLRFADRSKNAMNKINRVLGSTSSYRGVYARGNGWISSITKNSNQLYLGSFTAEEDAAKAYDSAARELFGEFARLNFPREDEQKA